jgi:NADP-dependent 3-hydroxy acid dehydrogenase YdfG
VDQPLVGRVVVVTGASSGLGASFAFHFYKVSAAVVQWCSGAVVQWCSDNAVV